MRASFTAVLESIVSCVLIASCSSDDTTDPISQIMNKPRYTSAKSQWSIGRASRLARLAAANHGRGNYGRRSVPST
jgi:hypothetical protein